MHIDIMAKLPKEIKGHFLLNDPVSILLFYIILVK